ncbi:hypothetical protein GLYMA_13G342232v4 [Glycine max]|nr:hypothetical protein GLYMA_13G342232v4 [Glycine max]KAH1104816.1 hypothetical protein GYH30_038252 [Glycine max]
MCLVLLKYCLTIFATNFIFLKNEFSNEIIDNLFKQN